MRKRCIICNDRIEPAWLIKKSECCSQKCLDEYIEVYKPKKYSKNLKEGKCAECGNVFFSKTKKKYCSSDCTKRVHKRRADENKRGYRITSYEIFKRDGFRCAYCGKSSYEDGVKLVVDHIRPVKMGGKGEISNLITSCEMCNLHKHDELLPPDILEAITEAAHHRNTFIESLKIEAINTHFVKDTEKRRERLSEQL